MSRFSLKTTVIVAPLVICITLSLFFWVTSLRSIRIHERSINNEIISGLYFEESSTFPMRARSKSVFAFVMVQKCEHSISEDAERLYVQKAWREARRTADVDVFYISPCGDLERFELPEGTCPELVLKFFSVGFESKAEESFVAFIQQQIVASHDIKDNAFNWSKEVDEWDEALHEAARDRNSRTTDCRQAIRK